jgi:predicted amidophosphoribosyltransferase
MKSSTVKQHQIISEVIRQTTDRVITYSDALPIKTSAALFNAGIKCCDNCGYMQPLEQKLCEKCGEQILLIKSAAVCTDALPKHPKNTKKQMINRKGASA